MELPKDLSFQVTSHPKHLCIVGGLNSFSLRFSTEEEEDIQVSSCELVEKLGMPVTVVLYSICVAFSLPGDRLGFVIELKTDYAIYQKFTIHFVLTDSQACFGCDRI
jgi:hypothetical protein